MAETVVWNKKLLVASLVLGLVAAGLFYTYESVKEARARETEMAVLKWRVKRKAGDEISEKDIEVARVARDQYVVGVLKDNARDRGLLIGYHLSRDVERGDFVRSVDISESQVNLPSNRIQVGYRGVPVVLDPDATPGAMVRTNTKVDLVGEVSIRGKLGTHTLIENVRVIDVGGSGEAPQDSARTGRSRRPASSMRGYRKILIELKPEVALQWHELLRRVTDRKVWLHVRHSQEPAKPTDGRIMPDVLKVLSQPLPPSAEPLPGT